MKKIYHKKRQAISAISSSPHNLFLLPPISNPLLSLFAMSFPPLLSLSFIASHHVQVNPDT